MPETSDSDFSWTEYVRRNNDELVATFGNLVHRVLTQVYRNFDQAVPDPGSLRQEDEDLIAKANAALEATATNLDTTHFRQALNGAMAFAKETNRYIDAQAPWKQIKENRDDAAKTLYASIYALSALKTALYPFLPFSAQNLHELLGLPGKVEDAGWTIARPLPGTALPEPIRLFTKLDDSVIQEMVELLG